MNSTTTAAYSPAPAVRRFNSTVVSCLVLGICVPWSLLQTEAARRILLGVIILDIPLQLGTHLWFRPDAAAVGALGGFNLSITTIALAGLYAGWLPRLAALRRAGGTAAFRISVPLLLYIAVAGLSGLLARDHMLAFFEVGLFVQMFLLYVYLASTVSTKDEIRFIAWMLLWGLIVESLLMFALAHGNQGLPLWGIRTRVDEARTSFEASRVSGSIGSANSAAAYLGAALIIGVGICFSRSRVRLRVVAAVAAALGSIALILTLSRGGWLATGLCLLMFLFLETRTRKNLSTLLVIVALITSSVVFLGDEITNRFSADDRGSAYSRVPLMRLAGRIIADHPILGVGSNNFGEVMNGYLTSDFRSGFLYTVHNQYLLIWAETGILGLASFLWFLIAAIWTGLKCWRQRDPELSPLALGMSLSLIAFMFHMSVDLFRGRPLTEMVWATAALISAIADTLTRNTGLVHPRSERVITQQI